MTIEFNGIVILGIVWFIASRIASLGRSASRGAGRGAPGLTRPDSQPGGVDPTQREGVKLEGLLRDLQRSLELASTTRQGTMSAPAEARSLEENIEPEVSRPVDLDDEAAEVEVRRIEAAEARNRPQLRVRPAAQEQIKAEPAEHTAARGQTVKQLRDAIVWREILDPPVSER
jgi:hypothetical protein